MLGCTAFIILGSKGMMDGGAWPLPLVSDHVLVHNGSSTILELFQIGEL
jgi:hypothetical protein